MARRGGGRDDAPDNHARRQIQGRLAELVEEEVGWDLHQQVAHEQDGHGRLVLGRRQAEVLLQPGELCRRDVVSVCVAVSQRANLFSFATWLGGSTTLTIPRGEENMGLEVWGCGALLGRGKVGLTNLSM